MHSPKQRDPASEQAIAAFLAAGGRITKVGRTAHGTCERKKGIQFRGKDPQQVREETLAAAHQEHERKKWINEHGGLKRVREMGAKAPWEN